MAKKDAEMAAMKAQMDEMLESMKNIDSYKIRCKKQLL